ncbi:uncharacterized protein BJ212DRAFT_1483305 [Suillus subaureus]|uniref:Uncharacterized protein n=1 Tax=Suillus subaureus TaxID=48587 RepID=A0A9P7JB36_9AGAM|nr:uncharacterized protein BJ212DRAFT_1483305 [Suillus subaureus]KAG1812123.1 hypothetical protein BJ212DRAFT_1483305 [Suillus subaureus]
MSQSVGIFCPLPRSSLGESWHGIMETLQNADYISNVKASQASTNLRISTPMTHSQSVSVMSSAEQEKTARHPLMNIQCHLDDNNRYGDLRNLTLLLTLIPCATDGLDPSSQSIEYKRLLIPDITDLWNIGATVGRVGTRRRWGIIERAADHIRQITFAELELEADVRTDDAVHASGSD